MLIWQTLGDALKTQDAHGLSKNYWDLAFENKYIKTYYLGWECS